MTDCPINWDDETDRMLAGDHEPSLFWQDLADDFRNPAFRRAFEAGWREARCVR